MSVLLTLKVCVVPWLWESVTWAGADVVSRCEAWRTLELTWDTLEMIIHCTVEWCPGQQVLWYLIILTSWHSAPAHQTLATSLQWSDQSVSITEPEHTLQHLLSLSSEVVVVTKVRHHAAGLQKFWWNLDSSSKRSVHTNMLELFPSAVCQNLCLVLTSRIGEASSTNQKCKTWDVTCYWLIRMRTGQSWQQDPVIVVDVSRDWQELHWVSIIVWSQSTQHHDTNIISVWCYHASMVKPGIVHRGSCNQ